jgi:ubiquitin-conjugating enzyme E2 M
MRIPIPKQVEILHKNLAKVFNYQVNKLTLNDDGSIYVIIEPSDGYWKGGRYPISITFPYNFPNGAPLAWNLDSELLHPNIAREGPVCLNTLYLDWKSSYGLEDIIQGLLLLFHHPDFDKPNSDSIYYYEII